MSTNGQGPEPPQVGAPTELLSLHLPQPAPLNGEMDIRGVKAPNGRSWVRLMFISEIGTLDTIHLPSDEDAVAEFSRVYAEQARIARTGLLTP